MAELEYLLSLRAEMLEILASASNALAGIDRRIASLKAQEASQ